MDALDRLDRVGTGAWDEDFDVVRVGNAKRGERKLPDTGHEVPSAQEVKRLGPVDLALLRVPVGAVVLDHY